MSLKRIVLFIAGDLSDDAFNPASWSDRKQIEGYCEGKVQKIIWDRMDKSVTHLVISRAAFKANHAALLFVLKDRRGPKKRPKIVTYDWLEDSLEDNKPIIDVSAYDPSIPRDVDAMVAARRKGPKIEKAPRTTRAKPSKEDGASEATKKAGPENNERSSKFDEVLSASGEDTDGEPGPVSNKAIAPSGDQASSTANTKSRSSQTDSRETGPPKAKPVRATKLPAFGKPSIPVKKPSAASCNRTGPNVQLDPATLWRVKAKARYYLDKTDRFPYCIKFTHKSNDEYWWLMIWESTSNDVGKSFMVCANQYKGKSNKPVSSDDRNPTPSSQEALKRFAEVFRMRMAYDWDERLLRASGPQPGNWRYELREDGKTGKTPPEFTPGNAKCSKVEELKPLPMDTNAVTQPNVGKAHPAIRQRPRLSIGSMHGRVMKPGPPGTSVQAEVSRAKKALMGTRKGQGTIRQSGSSTTLSKRKSTEPPSGPSPFSKITKSNNGNVGDSKVGGSKTGGSKAPAWRSKTSGRNNGGKAGRKSGDSKVKSAEFITASDDESDDNAGDKVGDNAGDNADNKVDDTADKDLLTTQVESTV